MIKEKPYGFGEILSVSSRLKHYADSLANLAPYDLFIRIAAARSSHKEAEVAVSRCASPRVAIPPNRREDNRQTKYE
jgi:hypothetical protein